MSDLGNMLDGEIWCCLCNSNRACTIMKGDALCRHCFGQMNPTVLDREERELEQYESIRQIKRDIEDIKNKIQSMSRRTIGR